jgi:hypothetical protein
VAGLVKFAYDLRLMNLSDSAMMGVLSGVMIWCVGLLADQMSRIALYMKSDARAFTGEQAVSRSFAQKDRIG